MGLETKEQFSEAIEWFLDHLRVERGASEHTLVAYHSDLAQAENFFRALGISAWRQVETQAIARYQSSLGPPLAAATAQRRLSSLRSLLKFLKKQGDGPRGDLPDTGGFKKPKRLPRALGRDQLDVLLATPDLTTPPGIRDRTLMELIYGAGLRVSEAVGLRLEQVNLDSAAMTVTGKREKTRWIPVPAQTIGWLERYLSEARPSLQKKPSALLLLSDRGLPLLRQTAYARLQRYSRLAGLVRVSPHTLRHTYAVHLLKGGADLRAVQELLGHESIATTQVYTQLDLDEVTRKYNSAHPRR